MLNSACSGRELPGDPVHPKSARRLVGSMALHVTRPPVSRTTCFSLVTMLPALSISSCAGASGETEPSSARGANSVGRFSLASCCRSYKQREAIGVPLEVLCTTVMARASRPAEGLESTATSGMVQARFWLNTSTRCCMSAMRASSVVQIPQKASAAAWPSLIAAPRVGANHMPRMRSSADSTSDRE